METWVSNSVKEGKISVLEGKEFLTIYRSGLWLYLSRSIIPYEAKNKMAIFRSENRPFSSGKRELFHQYNWVRQYGITESKLIIIHALRIIVGIPDKDLLAAEDAIVQCRNCCPSGLRMLSVAACGTRNSSYCHIARGWIAKHSG